MTIFRSARLEAVFGKPVHELTAADIHALVPNQVEESFDLDYKRDTYGNSDKDKREVAADIAALANNVGGLIILGVAEDEHARACAAPGVVVNDDEVSRLSKSAAGNLAPIPRYSITALEDEPGSGRGFILIGVPQSPTAPHAVLVNEGLRYAVRNNRDKRYLPEPEVADRYRRRFLAADEQLKLAEAAERDLLKHLDSQEMDCWLVLTLVPDVLGSSTIDRESLHVLQHEMLATATGLFHSHTWHNVRVGRRRYQTAVDYSETGKPRWRYAELHTSGVGVYAHAISVQRNAGYVPDGTLTDAVISGLQFLGGHARDRAMAGGDALVRATIVTSGTPASLMSDADPFRNRLGIHEVEDFGDPIERSFPLDDIAVPSTGLVSCAYLLLRDIVQTFGCPQPLKITEEGKFFTRAWPQEVLPYVQRWAKNADIELVDVLPN